MFPHPLEFLPLVTGKEYLENICKLEKCVPNIVACFAVSLHGSRIILRLSFNSDTHPSFLNVNENVIILAVLAG